MNKIKIVFNAIEGHFDLVTESNGAFQRILPKNLTLLNGESLVTSEYVDLNGKTIDLQGDSVIHILD